MGNERSYFLRKDEDKESSSGLVEPVVFSEKEFCDAKEYIKSREDFREDGLDYWGPNDCYLYFPSNRRQVQVQNVVFDVLERLVEILQPKYYIGGSDLENGDLISISQLHQ